MRRAFRRIVLAATTFTCGGSDLGDDPKLMLPSSRKTATVNGSGLAAIAPAAALRHASARPLGVGLPQCR